MQLNDFDYAGIAASEAAKMPVDAYLKKMAESQRSMALGMQLLQRQIDRMESRLNSLQSR